MTSLEAYRPWVVFGGFLFILVQQGLAIYLVYLFFFLLALLWWHQGKLLYMPQPDPQVPRTNRANPRGLRSPADWHMPYEDVAITTRDGVRISAWFIKQREAVERAPTVLYFHGNAGNIGNRLVMYNEVWEKIGCNVLAVDYRGYGDSEDSTPTERGLNADADAALAWVLARPDVDSSNVFVLGRSLGGAVTIALAARVAKRAKAAATAVAAAPTPPPFRFRGIVVENTFTSINDIGKRVLPFLSKIPEAPLHYFLTNRWRSIDAIARLPTDVPVLLVSGKLDEVRCSSPRAFECCNPLLHLMPTSRELTTSVLLLDSRRFV